MNRTILACAAGALLISAGAAMAEPPLDSRLEIIRRVGKDMFFLAPETRTRSGDTAEVWSLVAPEVPQAAGRFKMAAVWTHQSFDCIKHTARTVQMVALGEDMSVLFSGLPDNPEGPATPGTLAGRLLDFACEGTPIAAGAPLHGLKAALDLAHGTPTS
jgi:hypothetical protein